MKRVFIPNRGVIAVRIVSACRELGLECVVGASAADMDGMAAELADEVVSLGPGPAEESYLRPDVVVQAALDSGCDVVHPGEGFLSESPQLAALVRRNGLTFVGPPTEVLELAADPAAVRDLVEQAGFPALPGGGVASRARRVEVQVAADEHGVLLHLGDRDGSVQRRLHTVVEETPAPGLPDATAAHLAQAAVTIARQLGYRNLGSVDFVVDADSGEVYFVDVTCRIQTGHPLTEMVTGSDLVAMQLQLAGGRRIGVAQEDVPRRGHAVECRLRAEDPAHGYRPTPGTLSLFSVPERPGLRVDTYCRPGATVPPFYDPALATITAHADERSAAIDTLLETLEELDVDGVETNRMLLISILGHPDFRAGGVSLDWLEHTILR